MTFNPGDRVRLTILPPASGSIESTVDSGGKFVGWDLWSSTQADVEVLTPADDPSKDPVGTVRRRTDRSRSRPVIRQEGANSWRTLAGTYYTDAEVVGWEKLAPVEGTPAAEVVDDYPHYYRWDESFYRADSPTARLMHRRADLTRWHTAGAKDERELLELHAAFVKRVRPEDVS